jgi:hypothetical protein
MKKIAGYFFAGIMGLSSLSASCFGGCTNCGISPGTDWPSPINIDIGVGYRQDEVSWSIAGFNDTPNVLSELKWKDLQMIEVGGQASYVSCRNYVVQVSGDYGYICSGVNTDKDFLGDDRTDMFSFSRNNAGKGYVYDCSGAVGYRVMSTCGRFIAAPLVGYAFHSQHLHQFDGKQISLHRELEDRDIEGLDSSYTTRWYGPWVGLNFSARVESCAYVFGGFEWHMVSYRGTGHWNLRQDIGPFNDHAHGTGYVITLGGNWEIWDHWSIGVVSNFRYFRTRHGVDSTEFIFEDGVRLDVETRFNQAKWKSIDGLAFIGWRF